jgi:indole-3-glycerol phosphate synthase
MHKVLSLIVEAKKKSNVILRKSKKELVSLALQAPKPLDFARALTQEPGLSIIAEIKHASPSAGLLRNDFNHLQILKEYEECGAAAISVVTEEEFFLGRSTHLKEVKENTKLPVLRKDFIVDDIQVYQSRALGADAILLIAKVLAPEKLKSLYLLAKKLGMWVIVEIHNLSEFKQVMKLSPDIIGINNRNLDTFEVDLDVTMQIAPLISRDNIVISESGINSLKEVLLLKGLGVNAILVGEAFMRAKSIKKKFEELKVGCKD